MSETVDRISYRRRLVLEEEWRSGAPLGGILAKINAMPGPPITTEQMTALAAELGLRRPQERS